MANLKYRSLAWKLRLWIRIKDRKICHRLIKTTQFKIARARRRGSLVLIQAGCRPPQAIRINYLLLKWRHRESTQTFPISKKVSKSSFWQIIAAADQNWMILRRELAFKRDCPKINSSVLPLGLQICLNNNKYRRFNLIKWIWEASR